MESLGSLAGGVAHDMNNILGAILGITSLLREDDLGKEHARDYETIVQACMRGRTMVRGLLDFTRQELVDLQTLDLNVLAREQASLIGRNLPPTIQFVLDLASDLRPIRGDANTLGRSLLNLLMNAIDALAMRGTIILRTQNVPSGVELVVQDDGPGMTKEILDKALDPFFTTKPVGKGTGLGLAIVYGTMKAHRGQLELSSQPGQGVRACLRFPASEESHTQPPMAPSATTFPPSAKHNILLVDDDPLIQGAVSGMLRKLGHRVSSALTGAEALIALESPATFSLVILDLNMPVLDGAATLPRLRALRPTLPVILATGRADQAAQDLVRTYPLVTFLPKPFSFEELRQRIELATR
jgi:CheY-like chemotaxis protein